MSAPNQPHRRIKARKLLEKETTMAALKQAFVMLRPDIQWNNPVMFVVEVGAILTLLFIAKAALGDSASQVRMGYFIAVDAWLFLTVLFANFATALAEARGKAQAESLRQTRHDTVAFRLKKRQRHRAGFLERFETRRSGRRGGGTNDPRRRRDHRRGRIRSTSRRLRASLPRSFARRAVTGPA